MIPTDYSENLAQGKEAQVQILIDGSDSNTASIALGYAQGLISTHAARTRDNATAIKTGECDATADRRADARLVQHRTRLAKLYRARIDWCDHDDHRGAADFTVIARGVENGTMEQLLSTPVRPAELAMGKLAAYFLLGLVDMAIALFVGIYVFDVPVKGACRC